MKLSMTYFVWTSNAMSRSRLFTWYRLVQWLCDYKRRPVLGSSLYLEIRPQAPRFDATAAAIHGLDQQRLRREGLSRAEACRRLTQWVERETKERTRPVFVGHNAPFDWSFVNWTYASEELPNPFGYKALDTKALAMGVLDLHWLDASKETIQPLLNLPPEDKDTKHRAMQMRLSPRSDCVAQSNGDAPIASESLKER